MSRKSSPFFEAQYSFVSSASKGPILRTVQRPFVFEPINCCFVTTKCTLHTTPSAGSYKTIQTSKSIPLTKPRSTGQVGWPLTNFPGKGQYVATMASVLRAIHLVVVQWSVPCLCLSLFSYDKPHLPHQQFSILSTIPSKEYTPMPISHALVLDPWLEPLPSPGPAPVSGSKREFPQVVDPLEVIMSSVDDKIKNHPQQVDYRLPRMLVINSELFTLWKDHFARLQSVVGAWEPAGRRILSLGGSSLDILYDDPLTPQHKVGCEHASFSDFPVLPLIRKKSAHKLMTTITELSIAFLDGTLENTLDEFPTRKMEVEIVGKKKDGRPKRKLIGSVGDIIVC